MEIVIPNILDVAITATQMAMLLGFSLGLYGGDALAKFDGLIKYGERNPDGTNNANGGRWFKSLAPWRQAVVSALLDAFHHFQFGLALILWTMVNPWFVDNPIMSTLVYTYGWGMVTSDWKDMERVLDRLGFLVKELGEGG